MVGRTYRNHLYSVEKHSDGWKLLLELGGRYKNRFLPLTSNTEKEIHKTIDRFLENNAKQSIEKLGG